MQLGMQSRGHEKWSSSLAISPIHIELALRVDMLAAVQEEKAIQRGVLPVLRRATLVQTFGQKNHVCLREGSITIPPYAPPHKIRAHIVPPETPRSIFVYFRGLFYDTANDPEGGYYAR